MGQPDDPAEAGVESRPADKIHQLSAQAFQLAQQAARGQREVAQLERQAQAINLRLEALLPAIDDAPAEQRSGLIDAWNDARLDVGYVLSGGELATSTRLFYFLRDQKAG